MYEKEIIYKRNIFFGEEGMSDFIVFLYFFFYLM